MGCHFQRGDRQPRHIGSFLQGHFLELEEIDGGSLNRRQVAEGLCQSLC